jgi:electron transfer flavoprotein beta subunit
MKFAVCVKAVPDSVSGRRIDPATGRLARDGELALSSFDLHPVEQALILREALGGGELVVVSLGPPGAADPLRKALAMGADRTLLISDEAYAGADLLVTARALAEALRREQPELILFGQQSSDGEGACLWAAVAEHLGLPCLSQLAELSLAGGRVSGRRQTEYGYERISAPLPAIVAVSDAINQPRYPSLKGIMGAKSKPQQLVSAAELGGAGESRTRGLSLSPPPARGERRLVHDEGEGAEAIVAFLAERRLLP